MILKKQQNNQTGFIALISAIIITVVLLLVVTSAALTGFSGRFNILDSELKTRSSAIAEACVDEALLKLANDPNYPGNEDITVDGTNKCHINNIVPPLANPTIITTSAIYNDFHTNLVVTINPTTLAIISWQEVPTLP